MASVFASMRGSHPLDLLAPLVPASAAAYSGWQLAPFLELPQMPIAAITGATLFVMGGALMRRTNEEPSAFVFASFGEEFADTDEDADFIDLDAESEWHEEEVNLPATEHDMEEGILLLEDALCKATPDSRVVRLFEAQPMPTAGELQQRIERHLEPEPVVETGDELKQAIADLRHALRG